MNNEPKRAASTPPCPSIQSVQGKYLEPVLRAIEEGKLVNGPAMLHDVDRGVFLTIVVDQGLIVSWSMNSCATKAEAAREVLRTQEAVAFLASPAGRAAMAIESGQLPTSNASDITKH